MAVNPVHAATFHSDKHHHGHHHGHHHPTPTPADFNVAFALAVSLNLLFTLTEAGFALFANSMSLLADAGHNLGDVFGLVMAWGASLLVKRTATEKYSYGYKKTTLLAALGNALLLVFASALIVYESIYKFIQPEPVNEIVVIIIAAIGILINGGTALLFLRGKDSDLNIKGAYLHLASDALISISVVVTGFLLLLTKWNWLDPLVGLLIVAIILRGSWSLLRGSIDLILGAVPHTVNQVDVRNYLSNLLGVVAVHDLHIWALSTQEVALTAHLVMPNHVFLDVDYEDINRELKAHFNIHHVTIQVEKGDVANPCGKAEIC